MDSSKPKSATAQTLILVVLLADVGLVILGWYYYQQRQARYSAAGLNLSAAPAQEAGRPPDRAPPARPGPAPVPRAEPRPAAAARAPEPASARSAAATSAAPRPALEPPPAADAETARLMRSSAHHYFSVKNSERFRKSETIIAWRREFLSHPDLRAINDQYRQDKDAIRFMYHALRSPNFQVMVRKYSSEPDVQAFLREVAASPDVLGASRAFLSRYNLKAAVARLGISLPGAAEEPRR